MLLQVDFCFREEGEVPASQIWQVEQKCVGMASNLRSVHHEWTHNVKFSSSVWRSYILGILKKERKKKNKTLALFDFWVVAHHHLW